MKHDRAESQPYFAFDVRAFGAVGDGRTHDTLALQAAIAACRAQGGGTVLVPAGSYVTGALVLGSDMTLHLASGATLLGSEEPADYPMLFSRWEGREQQTHAPLIGGVGLRNVAITGRGTIDGRGAGWWQRMRDRTLTHPRPRLIALADCTNVLIKDITVKNSPSWTIHPVHCENVTVHNVTIFNPVDAPNTDGINPDSCSNVRISDCWISVGDDCITLKSGIESEAFERRRPCQNITITNCTMAQGHGGVVIGSEMSGDVRNVVISNCVFVGTDRGIRLKSRRGRGGIVEDVRVSNIVMSDVLCPFTINLYYGCGAWGDATVADKRPRPVGPGTPQIRRIHLSNISARGVRLAAAFLYGLAELPLEEISLSDMSIALAAQAEAGFPEMAEGLDVMQRAGIYVRNARSLRLSHIDVSGQQTPALTIEDSAEVDISGCTTRTPVADVPVVLLRNVEDAFVHGCRAAAGTSRFLQVEGARARGLLLAGNALAGAAQPLLLADGVQPPTSS